MKDFGVRLARFFPLLTLVLLCGCAATDQFDARASQIGDNLEQARDEMIVTNIVRASLAQPLSFFVLGQVGGTNQITSQVGLPAVIFGARQAAKVSRDTLGGGATGTGAANLVGTMNSTQFNVQPQETKDFYNGLLTPVSPETVAFFEEQGFSREVLFYLFSDRIIETRKGVQTEFINDPLDQTFGGFQTYVHRAMAFGLTTEPLEASETRRRASPATPPTRRARLCFDPSLGTVPRAAYRDVHPICGQPVVPGSRGGASFIDNGTPVEIDVRPRSTFGIFQFLGHVVADGDAASITLQSKEAIGNGPFADPILFHLERSAGVSCFVSISYAGGQYCAPASGAPNTSQIIGLLAQLIALSTTLNDLPQTSLVRIQQ